MKTPNRSKVYPASSEIVMSPKKSVRKRITRSLSQRLLRSSSHGNTLVKSKLRKLGLLSETVSSNDLATPMIKNTLVQPLQDDHTHGSGAGNFYSVKNAGSTPRPHLIRSVTLPQHLMKPCSTPLTTKNVYDKQDNMKTSKKPLTSSDTSEHEGKENRRHESRFSTLQRKLRRTRSHAADFVVSRKVIDAEKKEAETTIKVDENNKPKSRVARVKKALSFRKKKNLEVKKQGESGNNAAVTQQESVGITQHGIEDSVEGEAEPPLIDCPPPMEHSNGDIEEVDGALVRAVGCRVDNPHTAVPSLQTSDLRDPPNLGDTVPDGHVTPGQATPVSMGTEDSISENMDMYNDISNCSLIECLNNINMMASARLHATHYDADNSQLQTTIFDCTLDATISEADTTLEASTTDGPSPGTGTLLRSQKQWGAQLDLTKVDQDEDKTPDTREAINSSGDNILSLSGIKRLFSLNRSSSRSQSALSGSHSADSKFTLNRGSSKSHSFLNRSNSHKNHPSVSSKSKSQSSLNRSNSKSQSSLSNSSPKLRSSSKSQSSLDRISYILRTTLDRSYKKGKTDGSLEACKSNVSDTYVKRDSVCSAASLDTIDMPVSSDTPVSSEIGGSMNNLTLISTPVLKSRQPTEEEVVTRPAKRPRHPSVKFGDQQAQVKRAKVTRVNSIRNAWRNTIRRTTSHVEDTCGQHQGRGMLNRENAGHTPRVTRRNKQPDYDERLI